MALPSGTKLGPYEVKGVLGAGGMGEVYRAEDPRLSRTVAIKVLPEKFAHDPGRLARFEREARLLASFNHPHIAVIHGLEEAAGRRLLVMELVPGQSLADRLSAGPLPFVEALEVARQIADALEAAHEVGIVHRDLKPSNVQVSPDGTVKLHDFGLAKAIEAEPAPEDGPLSQSPTRSRPMTETGIILGSAPYMSPEQARGLRVDRRTDIWSFGVLLFEMITGRRLFGATTASDVLAAVLRAEPDWKLLPTGTPQPVRRLLARCLERPMKQRLHDMGDARIEIEEALAELGGRPANGLAVEAPAAIAPAWQRARGVLLAVVAFAFAAIAFGVGRWLTPSPAKEMGVIRSIVPLPAGTALAGWVSPVLALSRDGRKLAFVAETSTPDGDIGVSHVYLHHLDRGETQLVPDSDSAHGPFFSPDGLWIAFATSVSGSERPGELKKFSLVTGLTQSVSAIPEYFGGSWGDDGTIVTSTSWRAGPWRIASESGAIDTSTEQVGFGGREVPRVLVWPQLLPGGRSGLFVDADAAPWGEAAVLDLGSRQLQGLGVPALFARYVSTGHLLTLRPDGTLFAAPFEPAGGGVKGAAVAVLKDVAVGAHGAGALAVADTGTLVYATGYLRASGKELLQLVNLTFSGQVRPLGFAPDLIARGPYTSPDGRSVAVSSWDGSVWIYDLRRGARLRLQRGQDAPVEAAGLAWTPDGERIAFSTYAAGRPSGAIAWQNADGSADPETLVEGGPAKTPLAFTADGRSLLYAQSGSSGQEREYWLVPFADAGPPRRLLAGPLGHAALSPDGRFIAYASAESGRSEVYLRRFPSLEGKVQLSTNGGGGPRWSPDGRAVLHFQGDNVVRVRLELVDRPRMQAPELLFDAPGMRNFDLAPDGNGFVAIFRPSGFGEVRQLQLVTNWFEELERLAPAR
jgi:serine/threonine-protein kinase